MSRSFVNLAFSSTNQLELGGADEIAVLAHVLLECASHDCAGSIRSSEGAHMVGRLSDELSVTEAETLRTSVLGCARHC